MAASAQPVVLITGASRGIGLGLVETYAKKGYRVVAAARDPAKADKLQALVKANKSIATIKVDVSDSKSVATIGASLAALSPAVTAVDVLINNAGVASGAPLVGGAQGLSKLETETVENFINIYRTNVVGVWEVTEKVLPFLRKSKVAKVVNISSVMGSVEATNSGPWPGFAAAYRASKSALNELSAVQAREYNLASVTASADAKTAASAAPLITVLSVHPGWVDTDMGNGAGKPPTSVEQSVTGIEKVVTGAPVSAKTSFWDFEGKPVAW